MNIKKLVPGSKPGYELSYLGLNLLTGFFISFGTTLFDTFSFQILTTIIISLFFGVTAGIFCTRGGIVLAELLFLISYGAGYAIATFVVNLMHNAAVVSYSLGYDYILFLLQIIFYLAFAFGAQRVLGFPLIVQKDELQDGS